MVVYFCYFRHDWAQQLWHKNTFYCKSFCIYYHHSYVASYLLLYCKHEKCKKKVLIDFNRYRPSIEGPLSRQYNMKMWLGHLNQQRQFYVSDRSRDNRQDKMCKTRSTCIYFIDADLFQFPNRKHKNYS